MASIITFPDGTPATRASNFTRLCSEIIRKTEPGCLNCYKSDAAIGRYHPEGPIVQQCLSGGLWDAGASITVGGKHVANWLIGQVRDETQTEENMRAYAREIGADESSFMEAFRKVPAMPRKHFEEIAQALFTLANQLSREAYQNIMQARYIAERKRVEEDLLHSEAKNRAILTSVPDIMFIQSIDGVYLDYHTDNKKLLAVQPEQFLGKSIRDVLPAALAEQFLQCFKLAHETKEMQVMDYVLDVPNGSRYFEARINYMDEGRVLSIIRDMTENKRAEAELQKMQKLTSVGTLAGGIAHDFNNILMGLYGNLSLAKDELDQNHPAFEPLEDAEKSMNRAIRLTKQLLTFAKGGDPVKEDVSLGILVEEVARFDLSGSNVKLVYEHAEDLWLAEVDKGQMQQVISNLAINAREAMPNGGRLHISLRNVDIGEAEIPGLHKGKYIMITVADEGTGIENKYLERIFDPYFTTKQTGSGLGLATTYSIIRKHAGHIFVASELGKGTSFTLYLPASEFHQLEETNEAANEQMDFGRDVRILVMDDEEDILLLVAKMLRMDGYSVATAIDGKKAIEMYRQSLEAGEPFDIVITDLTIPGGLGGKEVVKQIIEIDPKATVIASSGYAHDPVMANYAEYGFRGIVAKPYTKAELSKLLVRILK